MFRSRLSLSGFVLIAALMLSGGTASAEMDTNSANHEISGCRDFLIHESTHDMFSTGWCAGTVNTLKYMGGGNHCSPSAVTLRQAVLVVVRYIDARPERMHENFKELALEAMKAAWPCRR
jgi:hypothetical protein